MALAVLSTEAWIPHGPWTQPSGSCQMTYKSGLGDNGPAYRRGCSKGVPSGAVAVHDARNQYACISRCFDAFIEGGGPLNVVLNITALWDGYEEDAAKRCHCVQNVVPEDGAVTSKSVCCGWCFVCVSENCGKHDSPNTPPSTHAVSEHSVRASDGLSV